MRVWIYLLMVSHRLLQMEEHWGAPYRRPEEPRCRREKMESTTRVRLQGECGPWLLQLRGWRSRCLIVRVLICASSGLPLYDAWRKYCWTSLKGNKSNYCWHS